MGGLKNRSTCGPSDLVRSVFFFKKNLGNGKMVQGNCSAWWTIWFNALKFALGKGTHRWEDKTKKFSLENSVSTNRTAPCKEKVNEAGMETNWSKQNALVKFLQWWNWIKTLRCNVLETQQQRKIRWSWVYWIFFKPTTTGNDDSLELRLIAVGICMLAN